MGISSDLTVKRIQAYEYIKGTICSLRGEPKTVSDVRMADILGGTLELKDSLRLLREGKHNPTKRLVEAFKREFRQEISESTIDAFLVDPFKTN